MRRITGTIAAITTAILLTACGSSDDTDTAAATPSPSKTAAAAAPSATASKSSAFLRPTPEQETALVAALTAINPGLTTKPERAVSRSVDVCNDILTGKDQATVLKNAASRYTGGDVQVDDDEAAAIVQAVKDTYCTT